MGDFEFIFSLYGLLLGLAMAELLSGLGNAMEWRMSRRADTLSQPIGWLTPLMALFVMLDLLSFWVFAWRVRTEIAVSAASLFGVTVFASAYYLAARLVFPRASDCSISLDDHFMHSRRAVFAILAALVVIQWLYLVFGLQVPGLITPFPIIMTAVLLFLMAGAALAKTPRLAGLFLVLLIIRYCWFYTIR